MTMRSHVGRARGLGSAKQGVGHSWHMIVTSVALVPLSLWFVVAMIKLAQVDYAHLKGWMSAVGNSTGLLLTLLLVVYHSALGLQMVIEDYVHCPGRKFASLIAVKVGAAFLAVFLTIAVLKVAIGV
jgi:succinate dehydrogenase / fumarate reductase membrane anchor subunit